MNQGPRRPCPKPRFDAGRPAVDGGDRLHLAEARCIAEGSGLLFLDWYFSEDLCTAFNLERADIVHFTRAERSLLAKLLAARGQVLDRDRLLDAVTGVGSDSSDRSIDFLITRLRRKLGDRARRPRYIETRYGEGYRWIAATAPRRAAEQATIAVGPVRYRLRRRPVDSVLVLCLQGHLAADSARLIDAEIRDEIAQAAGAGKAGAGEAGDGKAGDGFRHLLIDLRDVQGIDDDAVAIFACIRDRAREADIALVFSNVRESIAQPLRATGIRLFASLDAAQEWREQDILRHAPTEPRAEHSLRCLLARDAGAEHAATILDHLVTIDLPPREVIFRAGSERREMFFLEDGTTEAFLHIDGAWVRTTRIWPGTLFGEISFYCGAPRIATVMTVDPCHLVRIRPDALARLEADHPRAAIALYRFLTRRTAQRLISYNDMLVDFFRSTRA